MAQVTIQQAFDLAVQHQNAGRLPEAEQIYRQILAVQPQHSDSIQMLGVLAHAVGRNDDAVDLIRRALTLDPSFGEAYSNLGNALLQLGEIDQAINAYRQAIALRPRYAPARTNLGHALTSNGQFAEAITVCREAIALDPNVPESHNNLGNALTRAGKQKEAVVSYQNAIRLRAAFPEAHFNLGLALLETGRLDESIAEYRKAIALRPEYPEAYNNLGNALKDHGQLDEAIASYRQAITIHPDFADAYNNLGNALTDAGQLDEAIATYRQALAIDPCNAWIDSNLIYTLHFHPGYDAKAIGEEASRWSRQHAAPLARSIRPHDNDRDPERPLRIGYVSAAFRTHPVATNFLPLAMSHDRARFHIVCYSGTKTPDAVTDRLRSLASEWRETGHLSDEQLAESIRKDKIDILVDLGMHMTDNRLLVFARKPAPLQATCLCGMGTTGMPMIDYRISDQYSDPPGLNDAYYAEKTVRLPDCYTCHEVPDISPPVNALPATGSGHITFGSLNNFCKVTPEVLDLWGEILAAVPASRLLLRCPSGSTQARVRSTMALRGIAEDRIELLDRHLATDEYLCMHHRMDIYLDPFPYGGHTTSWDGLWMGVPLITLAGRTDVARGGVFLLTNLDMPEFVALTEQEYVQKAVELANDLPRLAGYRKVLRQRMLKSPLMDGLRFAQNVEAAYRQMWKSWCGNVPGSV